MADAAAQPKLGTNRGNAGKGRPKGVPNKATAEVKELAQQYTAKAVAMLASVMGNEQQPAAARVSAANALLDRAYGKPSQAVEHTTPDGQPIRHVHELSDEALAAIALGRR